MIGKRGLTTLVAGLSLGAFLLVPGSAMADVAWRLSSAHGPQNVVPGQTAQYVVTAADIGDTDTSTGYTIVDDLPAGVTATAASGGGWDCSATAFPAGLVACTNTDTVFAAGAAVERRGFATPLIITVQVAGSAMGTADNALTITGGSDTAAPASTTDPTTFDPTPAGFGFVPGSFTGDLFDAPFPALDPERQAGSHPFELRVAFRTNLKLSTDPATSLPYTEPDEHIRNLQTRLPVGFIGNPQAVPQCDPLLFTRPVPGNFGGCPANTQVGTIDLFLQDGETNLTLNPVTDMPVFNLVPPPGVIAQFGLTLVGNPALITVTLDPSDHYSVIATLSDTTELLWVRSASLAIWGVPADPAHDALRVDPDAGSYGHPFSGPAIRPFLTLPSQCATGRAVQVRADSWQHPGAFTPWQTGTSARMEGCDDPRFRFDPSVSLQPEALTPSTPTGLDVDVSVPQKDDVVANASELSSSSSSDAAIATPPLRTVKVTLPEGMTISPSSADGLAACNPLQIGLGTNQRPTCPDASKVGTVELRTPLLADPVDGSVYLATQTDNPFGSLLALYVVIDDPSRGLVIKLPGKVEPNAATGRLTATFADNPQLPFSHLRVHFKGGPRAALVTPATCGTKTTTATLTSWNESLDPVTTSDSFTISADGHGAPCGPRPFDPSFIAGTVSPLAGTSSPIVTRFARTDRDQELDKVDVSLPQGLLGRISAVTLCPRAAAAAGSCRESSRIGTAIVGAGPGSDPFYITNGRVYITGPYRGAPFGLSVVVHAKAGPFDLGDVVVRLAVFVNRRTSALRVVSDPLPRILAGIPLQLRVADVTIDRPGFALNPTSCAALHSTARMTSTTGALATKSSRFQAAGCNALSFHPRLSLTVGSKRHTHKGASTPLTARLRMPHGQSNIDSVSVTLPLSLTARLDVVGNACTQQQFDAGHCERARAGSAVAVTPLLKHALRGGAYFVKDPAKPAGSLPNLIVALRGQVDFDLVGHIRIPGGTLLATRFSAPDVPIKAFTLHLVAGSHGPLNVATNLCSRQGRRAQASIAIRGQNGDLVHRHQRLQIAGCGHRRAHR